jgi:hypothetical protein
MTLSSYCVQPCFIRTDAFFYAALGRGNIGPRGGLLEGGEVRGGEAAE